jgi:hypothetical protein
MEESYILTYPQFIENLMETFTGQSAGNANLPDVNQIYLISDHLPKHKKPDSNVYFGYYLAGLIEGDGCFSDRRLEIIFHENDIANAYFIKKFIGFGTVSKIKEKRAVKYVLRHMTGLYKVIGLINGKFRSENKINQWKKHNYESIFHFNILPPDQSSLVSNAWLAGFTDADGCFFISIVKSKTHRLKISIRLEFKISQKDSVILKQIQKVFGGSISYSAKENLFRYNSVNFQSAFWVVQYFNTFSCNSNIKQLDFIKWRKVYRIIQRKEHLTLFGLKKIYRIKCYKRNEVRDDSLFNESNRRLLDPKERNLTKLVLTLFFADPQRLYA